MAPGGQDIRAEIQAINDEVVAATSKGDLPTILARYTEDARIFSPGAEPITGRAAIEKMLKTIVAGGPMSIRMETMEAEDLGDTAIELGQTTALNPEGAVLNKYRYLVVWKKEGGKWKIHIDFAG